MVHTYEVWVDTREYMEPTGAALHNDTYRYEIDAETLQKADTAARFQARYDHPRATEYDIRITRLLK
ncbi:MAG: hypothetical protein ACFB8W_05405 [Elainellaceae cyanobacterium]